MPWQAIVGAVISVLSIIYAVVKNLKLKKTIENTQIVLQEVHTSLDDGKIDKKEWISVALKALETFIP